MPVLSIITVVRNCELHIENTILSVLNQNFSSIEYIIIDGASTDRTIDYIRKYQDQINYWISEPDRGIYDAMNKGISHASGDFVIFMNGGDEFYDNNTCDNVFHNRDIQNFDVIYGDLIAKDDNSGLEIFVKAKPLDQIWKGMIFSHQSAFIKLKILRKYPFELKYQIVSDFNQIINIYTNNYSFRYIPHVFSRVTIGGLSYSNIKTTLEQLKVLHSHKPFSIKLVYFIPHLIIDFIRIIIGRKGTIILRKLKWKYQRY